MSERASKNAKKDLEKMGVKVLLNTKVTDYRDGHVVFDNRDSLITDNLIWVSGVTANRFEGITPEQTGRGGRILVDAYNRVQGTENIFAVGDLCLLQEPAYPNGHPQVAQAAIQQGSRLAKNLNRIAKDRPLKPFHYKDLGTMATIGRNKAVADLHGLRLHGFFAWAMWLTIHLRSILGVRNKVMVLLNWIWNYAVYDQSNRFIFYRPERKKHD